MKFKFPIVSRSLQLWQHWVSMHGEAPACWVIPWPGPHTSAVPSQHVGLYLRQTEASSLGGWVRASQSRHWPKMSKGGGWRVRGSLRDTQPRCRLVSENRAAVDPKDDGEPCPRGGKDRADGPESQGTGAGPGLLHHQQLLTETPPCRPGSLSGGVSDSLVLSQCGQL